MLTINALAAADEVIIAVNPQFLAMMGLQDYLRTVTKIRRRINPKLKIAGILMTMCEARTNLCRTLTEQVTEIFQGQIRIFDTRIPHTVKVGESIITACRWNGTARRQVQALHTENLRRS